MGQLLFSPTKHLPAHLWAYAEKGQDMTQYQITHMENLMVRDEYWDDGCYWDDDEEDP